MPYNPLGTVKRGRVVVKPTKRALARFLQLVVLTRKEVQDSARAPEGWVHTPSCICLIRVTLRVVVPDPQITVEGAPGSRSLAMPVGSRHQSSKG